MIENANANANACSEPPGNGSSKECSQLTCSLSGKIGEMEELEDEEELVANRITVTFPAGYE